MPRKRGLGRPSKYRKEFAKQAGHLCKLGATDVELAAFFNVNQLTINRWKYSHPDFCKALKTAKAEADARVERSLYQRATGYSHDAVKLFQYDGVVISEPYVEHYPPDTTACIFWLKNRKKEAWRDRHELTGADGGPLQVTRVNYGDKPAG